VSNVRPDEPFQNIGFAGACLLALGCAAAARSWSRPAHRPYLVWAGIGGAVTIAQILSPSNAAMSTTWAPVLGRHLVPCLAPILVLGGRVRPSLLRVVLLPVLLAESFLYAPREWPHEIVAATGAVLGTFGVGAVAVTLIARARAGPLLRWPALALAVAASLSVITLVHDRMRYTAWRLFAEGRLDDFHSAGRLRAWPIWQRLDELGPVRVAAAAGWDGIGHNWFRYGLLGPRLQRDVVYVPVTSDGSIVDYADAGSLASRIDREAWLRRLEDLDVDWVVVTGPRTVEQEWIDEMPEVFSVEWTLAGSGWILARVNAAALSQHIGSR
jgi:hypothetical protein